MDEEQYVGRSVSEASFATSTKSPLASTLPAWISCMAYPTQLRTSSAPCRSQVFDDSVIQTRRYRVETGASASVRVTVPPFPSFTTAEGDVFHSPCGPPSKSNASLPTQ